jgi:hypothetical protein
VFGAEGFDGLEDGLAFENHALAAAVGGIIGGVVFVVGPIAEVMGADCDEAAGLGFAEDAFGEGGGSDLGEEGEDIDEHGECVGRG